MDIYPSPEVLFIEWVPGVDFALLPTGFTERNYNDIPASVVLLDPAANDREYQIAVVKVVVEDKEKLFFTEGWKNLGEFYGYFWGYIRMTYLSPGRFIIQVTNTRGEVVYPTPVVIPLAVGNPDFVDLDLDQDPPEIAHLVPFGHTGFGPYVFPHIFMKTLTHADMAADVLFLPAHYCELALRFGSEEIKLIDELGKRRKCEVKQDVRDARQYVLSGRWSIFRHFKGLAEGQDVKFGVTEAGTNAIHYIPIYGPH